MVKKMHQVKKPYLLFLGDSNQLSIKTARGIMVWRPEDVVGEYSDNETSNVTVGARKLSIQEAWEKGARSFVIGVANSGGFIADNWFAPIKEAIECGFDIVSGMHEKLSSNAEVEKLAKDKGVNLIDIRHLTKKYKTGTGIKRSGKRILTVGTDCSVGKMFTSLAMEQEMKKRGFNVEFKATGQTGILVSGSGIPIDAVIADFIAGAAEELSPNNDHDHFDIIEGQGSLFHPSFAGVSLGLLHGSQPDYLVLCHDPFRKDIVHCPGLPLPSLQATIESNIAHARLTNPNVQLLGIALNNMRCDDKDLIENTRRQIEKQFSVPTVDPIVDGTARIVDCL